MKTVVHYRAGTYLPITGTWIYGQIKNLRRYQPVVYAHEIENLDIFPTEKIKIRSLNLKLSGRTRLFFYLSFASFLIRDKADIVHAHFGHSGYNFLPLKNIFRLPLITTFYGFDLSLLPAQNPEWQIKYKKLFQKGEIFLVEGNHMKKSLIDLGCPEEKAIVQHLGIDLDQIKFMPREVSEDVGLRILIAARFREKKGIPYAVEAFGRVKQAHPELKLTIIGDSSGSPEEEAEKKKIFETIRKYNLKDCINMLGYQPYSVFLRESYRHHIFIHPSVHASDGDAEGGAPVSIIEASASGMPILSTMHCDIPEVVINGESGFLVPERDVDALAERLEFLVSNHVTRRKMGSRGREHIENNYNVKKQVQRLEGIYDEVLTGVT